jgi:anthranilate synthase component II
VFIITAEDDNGVIMAVEHQQFDLISMQFHPEGILTPDGEKILANWLHKS